MFSDKISKLNTSPWLWEIIRATFFSHLFPNIVWTIWSVDELKNNIPNYIIYINCAQVNILFSAFLFYFVFEVKQLIEIQEAIKRSWKVVVLGHNPVNYTYSF